MWNLRLRLERNPHSQVPFHRSPDRRHSQGTESWREVGYAHRKYGISETTLYNGRSKYGGLEVSDLAKLRQLEDENRRLKKIVADQALNIEALKIVAEGNF
jgi:putative transposase